VVWFGLLAPTATPRPIVDKLNAVVVKNLAAPDFKRKLAEQAAEAVPGSPEQFSALISAELEEWAEAGRASGRRRAEPPDGERLRRETWDDAAAFAFRRRDKAGRCARRGRARSETRPAELARLCDRRLPAPGGRDGARRARAVCRSAGGERARTHRAPR